MTRALWGVAAASVILTGCTTAYTVGAESVRVTANDAVVKGCRYIGEAKGRDRMNGGMFGMDKAEENSHRRLKNAAFQMGGTTVHLQKADWGSFGASARGEVYDCPPAG